LLSVYPPLDHEPHLSVEDQTAACAEVAVSTSAANAATAGSANRSVLCMKRFPF
jgi:hypothetical protein